MQNKVFSLVLWKRACEIIKKRPRVGKVNLAKELDCTEATAREIIVDYKELFKKKK